MPICGLCHNSFDRGIACPFCGMEADPAVAHPVEIEVRGREDRSVGPQGLRGRAADVVGVVVQSSAPVMMAAPRDRWKWACGLLMTLALLPIVVAVWIALFALRLALTLIGWRRSPFGGGLLDEFILFHGIGRLFHPREPVAVVHHVVETSGGMVLVRQVGELEEGGLFVGNEVALRGSWRGGMLVIEDGFNDTLGARVARRRGPWKVVFAVLAVLVVLVYAGMMS